MKLRIGFVSNSSSSSFMIYLENLTAFQLAAILQNKYDDQDADPEMDAWIIELDEVQKAIKGYTSMDNYSMSKFFDRIKVKDEDVIWIS